MTIGGWISTAGGVALIAIALRDVFDTLLLPSGEGRISPHVLRATSAVARRLGGDWLRLGGPLGIVAVIAFWTVALVGGWALVYAPHVPEGFAFAEGLRDRRQHDFLDAAYVSLICLTTLGFGDVVAVDPLLRLMTGLQALIGFALITASISWILSIYPALMRRRVAAARIRSILDDRFDPPRLNEQGAPEAIAPVLDDLVAQLLAIEVDLLQFPATYFFVGPPDDEDFPRALQALHAALADPAASEAAPGAVHALRFALQRIGERLVRGPFGLDAQDADEALAAYWREETKPFAA